MTSAPRDAFYTTICNTLDYTAAGFPVTFADKELDLKDPPHQFRNHEDEAVYKLCTCSFVPFFLFSLSPLGKPLTKTRRCGSIQTIRNYSMEHPLDCS